MAASYSNFGGTGNRASNIITSSSAGFNAANSAILIDGVIGATSTFWFTGGAASGVYVRFQFLDAVLITEAKWYQQNTSTHGTFKWQGSPDGSTWTDIGSSFTLGGAATQTQTSMSANTTLYRYYQLIGVSGTTSSSPYLFEIEFKLDGVNASAPSYYNPYGSGDRRGLITYSFTNDLLGLPNFEDLFSGALAASNHLYFVNAFTVTSTTRLTFRFDAPRVVTEARWWQSTTTGNGTWKWQGSNDGSTWTDIGSSFTLGGALIQDQTQLNGNTTAYEYYRLLGVSGTTSNSPNLLQIAFKISYSSTPVALPNWGSWTFPNGAVGIAYEQGWDMPLSASPMTYTVQSGALPGGLSLDDQTANLARVYGTPTTLGAFTFTLRAVNSAGTTDKSFTITITAPSSASGGAYTFLG